ncbi:hypothetical protein HBI68_248550 [Parastagonospora nodorum]|nr:hypothetical protein HBI68_248550 [Parastagonospora nodorum]
MTTAQRLSEAATRLLSNVLFKLQAPDTDEYGQPGLLAQFAIDACTIIAGEYTGSRDPASSNDTLAPLNLTIALLMRDGSCRLSGCREQLQVAHVVLQLVLDWWKENDISRYTSLSTSLVLLCAVGVDMLYARFAWSVFTLLDAFLECKIDRRLALRATDARLLDARGFVAAVNCKDNVARCEPT